MKGKEIAKCDREYRINVISITLRLMHLLV